MTRGRKVADADGRKRRNIDTTDFEVFIDRLAKQRKCPKSKIIHMMLKYAMEEIKKQENDELIGWLKMFGNIRLEVVTYFDNFWCQKTGAYPKKWHLFLFLPAFYKNKVKLFLVDAYSFYVYVSILVFLA